MNDENKNTGPTPERLAKAGDHMEREIVSVVEKTASGDERESEAFVYRLKDSPIDRLAFGPRAKITGEQYHAAIRYFEDHYKAGLMPTGVIDPSKERVDGGNFMHISDAKVAAMVRHEHAIKALDYELYLALNAIVIQEIPFADFAERFTLHKTSRGRQEAAIAVIRLALNALARHYSPPRRDGGIGASHAGDYRPKISPS